LFALPKSYYAEVVKHNSTYTEGLKAKHARAKGYATTAGSLTVLDRPEGLSLHARLL